MTGLLAVQGGIVHAAIWSNEPPDMNISERVRLRNEVLGAFRHAYGAYVKYACEYRTILHLYILGHSRDTCMVLQLPPSPDCSQYGTVTLRQRLLSQKTEDYSCLS